MDFGLRQNLTLMALDQYARPWLKPDAERAALATAVKDYGIRTGSLEIQASSLSGGNQQKLALAKVLQPKPKIVVLDEPTRGVDVGAKRDIYFLIQRLAREGHAVIVISSELVELIGLCHRVAVMRAGRIVATLDAGHLTEEELIAYATRNSYQRNKPDAQHAAYEARPRWTERLHGFGPVVGLVLLCVAGTALNSDFATLDNVMNVLTRTAFIGIIAVGMCFVIISGGIDLSVGSMAALIAGCVIMFINWAGPATGSPLMAVVLGAGLAVVLGAVFGLAHGLLITKGRIEPFIVITLGTLAGIFLRLPHLLRRRRCDHAGQRAGRTSTPRCTTPASRASRCRSACSSSSR